MMRAHRHVAEQHPELDVVLLSRQVPGSMTGDRARARLHATVHNVANPDKLHAVAEGVKRI